MGEMRALSAPCILDTEWHGLYWGGTTSGIACGVPSSATATLACVHEHIDEVRICYGCVAEMCQVAGEISCPRCWDSEKGHACCMLVVIDWDSGEKTVVQEAGK